MVNENDTVAVEELKFGDNDTLSAQVAALVSASHLFLLTDVDGLYSSNPATDPAAVRIPLVEDISQLAADVSQSGTAWGTGGMATKLTAARLASAAGCRTVICKSDAPGAIALALSGQSVGTLFLPVPHAAKGRRRWLLALPPRGELWLDAGAAAALGAKKSLFPAGVVKAVGRFGAQDAVRLCDSHGGELARGLANYSAAEVEALRGKSSRDYESALGCVQGTAHREGLSFLGGHFCFFIFLFLWIFFLTYAQVYRRRRAGAQGQRVLHVAGGRRGGRCGAAREFAAHRTRRKMTGGVRGG